MSLEKYCIECRKRKYNGTDYFFCLVRLYILDNKALFGIGQAVPLTKDHILVGGTTNVATDVPVTGDASIDMTGKVTVRTFRASFLLMGG